MELMLTIKTTQKQDIEKAGGKITVRFNDHIYIVHLNDYMSVGTKITKFQ